MLFAGEDDDKQLLERQRKSPMAISPEYELELQREILSGEHLLWSGQPSRSVVFHSSDWATIPISLLIVGFTVFWEYGATDHFARPHDVGSAFFAVWGIPFILVGQYMLWGRFLYMAWRKPRTIYAVTNRRVLNLGLGVKRKVVDGSLATLNSVSITEDKNGFGTIEFSPEPTLQSSWGSNWNNSARRWQNAQSGPDFSRLAFYDIHGCREVYRLIQTQRERVQTTAYNSTPFAQ